VRRPDPFAFFGSHLETRQRRARQQRQEIGVDMRCEAELIVRRVGVAGVADQSQGRGRLVERGDEIIVRQAKRGAGHRHQLRRQRPYRLGIGQRGGFEFRHRLGPFVQAVQRIAGHDPRIVGAKVVDNVETLAEVRLRVHMHLRRANDLRPVRQITDVQVADPQRQLALRRKIEKRGGGGECAVDQALVDAVVGDHQESRVPAGRFDRARQRGAGTRFTGQIRADVQQRNPARRIGRTRRGESLAHGQSCVSAAPCHCERSEAISRREASRLAASSRASR